MLNDLVQGDVVVSAHYSRVHLVRVVKLLAALRVGLFLHQRKHGLVEVDIKVLVMIVTAYLLTRFCTCVGKALRCVAQKHYLVVLILDDDDALVKVIQQLLVTFAKTLGSDVDETDLGDDGVDGCQVDAQGEHSRK